MILLGNLGGGYGSGDSAVAINNNSVIVGSSRNNQGKWRAVRWPAGSTTAQDLRTLVGFDETKSSYAYAINEAARIAGKSQVASGAYHAYRTEPNPQFILLGDDLGTMNSGLGNSEATDLNDFDEVTGASDTASGEYRAFFKTAGSPANQGFTDLGVLPGGNRSLALGINNAGQVVGKSRTTSVGGDRAFVWYGFDSGGAPLALQNLNNRLANPAGWMLVNAGEINDSGWIAGWGYFNGQRAAFVLKPNY